MGSNSSKAKIDALECQQQALMEQGYEEVLKINDNTDGSCYPFAIETTRYHGYAKQLIAAIDPFGWQNITDSIARDIKADEHFQ
ncbi:unnamed protein product, partial [Rotaria sordida]